MKIRNDFVTNSSSSSFILTFKNELDYKEFKKTCSDFNYKELYDFMDKLRPCEENKENALHLLDSYYKWNVKRTLYDKYIDNKLDFKDQVDLRNRLDNDERFIKEFEEALKNSDYYTILKSINEDEIVISGTITDFEGGLIEYALRNDLLNDWIFNDWRKLAFNVG